MSYKFICATYILFLSLFLNIESMEKIEELIYVSNNLVPRLEPIPVIRIILSIIDLLYFIHLHSWNHKRTKTGFCKNLGLG